MMLVLLHVTQAAVAAGVIARLVLKYIVSVYSI